MTLPFNFNYTLRNEEIVILPHNFRSVKSKYISKWDLSMHWSSLLGTIIFWFFQGDQMGTLGRKGLRRIFLLHRNPVKNQEVCSYNCALFMVIVWWAFGDVCLVNGIFMVWSLNLATFLQHMFLSRS